MNTTLTPAHKLRGKLPLPGDKSISHRALMIAAIAAGESSIENVNQCDDVKSTVRCLRELGVRIESAGEHTMVHGVGLRGLRQPKRQLDVGNSGTTMRLLSGILAGQQFSSDITGDASIRRRPMARIIRPLQDMGAKIAAHARECAPLQIQGGPLHGISYTLPVASAQVKSCLLLASLYADRPSNIAEPVPTRNHTELLLKKFGSDIAKTDSAIAISPAGELQAQSVLVPGDLSAAAFFVAAALLTPHSEVLLQRVGINPTRNAFLKLLVEMGAEIEFVNVREVDNELIADLLVRTSTLQAMQISGSLTAQVIDEIPILTVLATQAEGRTEIRDAGELRVKESDRLAAMAHNLTKMGAHVKESKDGLIITGPCDLTGAAVETFGDHRIAMAMSVAALIAEGSTEIANASCVAISFPDFFDKLRELNGTR